MAIRIKVCPNCKTHNAPTAFQCSNCNVDLSGVSAKSEAIVKKQEEEARRKEQEEQEAREAQEAAEASVEPAPTAQRQYRICPECNHHNPLHVNLCEACNGFLAGVDITEEGGEELVQPFTPAPRPVVVQEPVQSPTPNMRSIDGHCTIALDFGETLIGAGNVGADYLVDKMFVTGSRPHCKVTREADGNIYIEDMGSTNGTFIDGKKIAVGQRVLLTQANVVGLGGSNMAENRSAFFRLMQ
jgi:hypothetical protein